MVSRAKGWLLTLAFAFLALIGLLLLLPTFVGNRWVYDPLIRAFAKDKFKLEVEGIALGWWRPIEFRGVSLSDLPDPGSDSGESPKLLQIRAIKTDRGIVSFLMQGRRLGRVEIIEPRLDISLIENRSNLERLVDSIRRTQKSVPASTKQEKPKIDIDVAVRRLSIEVNEKNQQQPLVVVPPFDLEGSYRAVDEQPTVRLSPTRILDQVVLTPELIRLGLGYVVPLLAKSVWFDGKVSLDCDEIIVPLESPLESQGKASLTLHQVRTGPSEPLITDAIELIARLRNKKPDMELVFVDGSRIDVAMQDQRVFHSGIEAGLPKVDDRLQFSSSGSVGLKDQSLELVLLVPVPIEQLARRASVQELGVPKLRVPVGGTLQVPQVDWGLMRKDSGLILAMMAGQLEGEAPITSSALSTLSGVAEGQADEAIAAAAELVRSIRERRKNNQAGSPSATSGAAPSASSEEESATRRPLRDLLRRAMRPDNK